MTQSFDTTVEVFADMNGGGQAVDFDGDFVTSLTITNNSGVSVQYSADGGVTWATVASGAAVSPSVPDSSKFFMRRLSAGGSPAKVRLNWRSGSSPFLYDPTSGDVVGIRDADGGESYFPRLRTSGGTRRAIVATRSGVYNMGNPITLSDGTLQGSTYRFGVFSLATEDIFDLQLAFGNWYVFAGVADSERANANDITISASIEYPVNSTPKQLYFDGEVLKTIKPGATVYSDVCGITIPANTSFRIRTYVHVASLGQKWPLNILNGTSIGDGSNNADVDITGTTGAATAAMQDAAGYGPLAIFGRTRNAIASVGIVGDSIAQGFGDTATGVNGNVGYIERALQNQVGYLRLAKRGETVRDYVGANQRRLGLVDGRLTDAIVEYGVNDITGGRSLSQITTDMQATINQLTGRGIKVWLTTLTPSTTSTDSWATVANQTPNTNFGPGEIRDQYNALVRSGAFSGVSGYFDPALICESGSTGKWIVSGTNGLSGAATTDGIHPSPNMSALMAACISPVVFGR